MFNRLMVFVSIFVFAVPVSFAESMPTQNFNAQAKSAARLIMRHMRSIVQFDLAAELSGFSTETRRSIEANLKKSLLHSQWPRLNLVRDQVFIDGHPTGITFSSYSPLNIVYRGEIWTYRQGLTPDENYFSLISFLSRRRVSVINWILPAAYADAYSTRHGFEWGAGIGLVAGTVMFLFGPATWGVATTCFLIFPSVFGGIGTGIGHLKYRIENARDVKRVICSGRLQFDRCEGGVVSMSLKPTVNGVQNARRITVDASQIKTRFSVLNRDGKLVNPGFSSDQKEALEDLARACSGPHADKILAGWKAGIRAACPDSDEKGNKKVAAPSAATK